MNLYNENKLTMNDETSNKHSNGIDLSHIYLKEKVYALPALFDINEHREFESKLIENIEKFYTLGLYERLIDSIYDLVDFYVKSNNYDLAKDILDKSIKDFEKISKQELVFEFELQKIYLMLEQEEINNISLLKNAMASCKRLLKTDYVKNNPIPLAKVKHELGIIYAEMAVNNKDAALLSTISIASFKEAISILEKNNDNYLLAEVYVNFGTSYFKYPETIENDNADLAILYLTKAYNIFNVEYYPEERVLTILNIIESLWWKKNQEDFDEDIYNLIINYSNEVLFLNIDEKYNLLAKENIENIEKLKELSSKTYFN